MKNGLEYGRLRRGIHPWQSGRGEFAVFIRSNLFSKGHPTVPEPGLSCVLDGHKRSVLNKIRDISDLDQMTDAFLARLVKDSLVEPLCIQFGKMTRKHRAETLDASYLPAGSMGARRYSRMGNFPFEGGNSKASRSTDHTIHRRPHPVEVHPEPMRHNLATRRG
jgi:hypothetical protein